jgi:hypothetical protein
VTVLDCLPPCLGTKATVTLVVNLPDFVAFNVNFNVSLLDRVTRDGQATRSWFGNWWWEITDPVKSNTARRGKYGGAGGAYPQANTHFCLPQGLPGNWHKFGTLSSKSTHLPQCFRCSGSVEDVVQQFFELLVLAFRGLACACGPVSVGVATPRSSASRPRPGLRLGCVGGVGWARGSKGAPGA